MDTSLIPLLLGVASFIAGAIAWYRGAVEKRYAAERDFQHLRRNYEQLAISVKELDDCLKETHQTLSSYKEQFQRLVYESVETNRALVKIEALILNTSSRMDAVASKLS